MEKYEYGAMSSKYQLEAENKLTAYSAMIFHFEMSSHLIALYSPEEIKKDSWLNPTGAISESLDEVFGGENEFDKYVSEHIPEIQKALDSITQLI